ncbi:MAG: protein kinase [Candidatus Aminicenantes bacterium]|nr:protein kinase [Candidatus Aminicenantes bacterium]
MLCPQCHCHNLDTAGLCAACGAELLPAPSTLSYPGPIRPTPIEIFSAGRIFADKYEIKEELGRGGMGVVYKARDIKLGRLVALKFLSPLLVGDEIHGRRFIQEAQTASALNHPHICTVYEVGESEGTAFIAMEHIEGRPLSTRISPGGLSGEEVVRLGLQITEALQHAHRRNIIHRDLKTANIIVTPEGQAKVLDFGLAKRLQFNELREAALSRLTLTQSGFVAGTLHSMAPEVLSGEPAGVQGDIWSLGIVLYEMATGKLPFEGRTGFELSSSILRDVLPPWPARVPEQLRSIIQGCLEKNLDKRYKEAGQVRSALEAAASPQAASGPATRATGRLKKLPWLLAGGAALVALILIVALILRSAKPPGLIMDSARVSTGAKASSQPEANEYFEKAMLFLMAQFDLGRARDMLKRSLEIDPRFAEARAWYGFTYILEIDSGLSNDSTSLYTAEDELRRALRDGPETARIYSSFEALYLYQGRKELIPAAAAQALKINPAELDANNWLANYYASNNDNSSAKVLIHQLLKNNPLFFAARMSLADILRYEGNIAGAIVELKKILEQSPRNYYATQRLARAYIDANDTHQARLSLESLSPEGQKNYEITLTWALLLAREGKKKEALQKMDADTLKYANLAFWSTSVAAEFYALLGDSPKALQWLEQAARNGDEREEWFRRDPLLASVRDEPKFKQIIRSITSRLQQRRSHKQ